MRFDILYTQIFFFNILVGASYDVHDIIFYEILIILFF